MAVLQMSSSLRCNTGGERIRRRASQSYRRQSRSILSTTSTCGEGCANNLMPSVHSFYKRLKLEKPGFEQKTSGSSTSATSRRKGGSRRGNKATVPAKTVETQTPKTVVVAVAKEKTAPVAAPPSPACVQLPLPANAPVPALHPLPRPALATLTHPRTLSEESENNKCISVITPPTARTASTFHLTVRMASNTSH